MLACNVSAIRPSSAPFSGAHGSDMSASAFDETRLERLRRLLGRRPASVRRLLGALGSPSASVSRRAFELTLNLGAVCGEAMAILFPKVLAEAERTPPRSAQELRRLDATLCTTVTLIERLAPGCIPALCVGAMSRHAGSASSWWTFRARQRLNAALQQQIHAGDSVALDAVLDLVAEATVAVPGSEEQRRGEWAVRYLVPCLPEGR